MNEIDYSKIDELPHEADRLMKIFIRFEFALKDVGYLKERDVAEPDWDIFAKSMGDEFFEVTKAEVPTLVDNPPKKQIRVGNSLEWKETEPVNNTQMLFAAVRRVRNNLLHGGKSGDPDFDRNEALIKEALSVLEHALVRHPSIRTPFEGSY